MRLSTKTLCVTLVTLALTAHAHAAEAASEGGFFSDTWRQVTDMVTPAAGGDSKPRHATEQSITVKEGAVAVDASNIATQVRVGDDDVVVLQAGDGSSVAPAVEEAEPAKKADAPAAKESSMWDDMLDTVGLGGDTPKVAETNK